MNKLGLLSLIGTIASLGVATSTGLAASGEQLAADPQSSANSSTAQQGDGTAIVQVAPIGGGGTDAAAPIPPDHTAVSPTGVDMRAGAYKHVRTEVGIGDPDNGGLTLERFLNGDMDHAQGFGRYFAHSWDIRLEQRRVQVQTANTPSEYDYQVSINYEGLGTSFRADYSAGSLFREIGAVANAKLTYTGNRNSGAVYTFTARDGTTVLFRPISGTYGVDCTALDGKCVYASKIIRPDGLTYDFEYDSYPNYTGGEIMRLRSVVSNRGYALLFEYNPPTSGYHLISKACALNLAEVAKPSTNVCPAGVSTATFTYSGIYLTSATEQAGEVETVVSSNSAISLQKGGQTAPYVSMNISWTSDGDPYVTSQQFSTGESYVYTWDQAPAEDGALAVGGGSYVNSAGQAFTVKYGQYQTANSNDPTFFLTPGPEKVTDELGRITNNNFCVPNPVTGECVISQLQTTTRPEGDVTSYTYDPYRNITQITRTPKPGSALPTLIEQRGYSCTTAVLCAKPIWIKDPRGNQTDFSYASHGGILSEMGPAAAAGGARPLKLTSWVQRYAWIKNSSGVLVQAATPVWVKASETQCQTVAGGTTPVCDGSALQTVTSYEYGASGTSEAVLVKGVAVSSGGTTLRTCYRYDTMHRKIAETTPNANLAVCP